MFAGSDTASTINTAGGPPPPNELSQALALGLPLEPGWTAPECTARLSAVEQMVHDLVDGTPGLSKRQLLMDVRRRWQRAAVLRAVEAGRCAGWLAIDDGPRRAHRLRLLCCGSPPPGLTASSAVGLRLEPRRPLDGYDAVRLRMLVEVLRRLLAERPPAVLRAYSRAWRAVGAPGRPWAEEGEVWQELADVEEGLLRPALAFLYEAEFLPADASCLLVDPLLRERVREYGQAYCDPCGQVHQLRRRK